MPGANRGGCRFDCISPRLSSAYDICAYYQEKKLNNLLSVTRKFCDSLDRITGWICVSLCLLMTVVVLLGVFFRYVLLDPISWSEELSTFMMVWVAMLGASMGIRRGRHVGVSYVVDQISLLKKNKRRISITVNFLILIFLYVLVKEGLSLALFARNQISTALGLSMFWPYFGLLVGGVVTAIQVACQIFEAFADDVALVEDDCSLKGE